MADRADITPELCRQLLRYEPETGKLFWRPRPREMFDSDRIFTSWNTKWAGKPAFATYRAGGCSDYACYVGSIFKLNFKAHRVAWAIMHGVWPVEIDHINGDPLDNRIENLRSVSRQENAMNAKMPAHNTSGYFGVHWAPRHSKWLAKIKIPGSRRYKHLGLFESATDAALAFDDAKRAYGYHANHGRE